MTVERTQDCNPFLDFAAEMRKAGNVGSSEMRYAMSIPNVIVEHYCNKRGILFSEFMQNPVHVKNLVNDPDFKKLRIWEGRI